MLSAAAWLAVLCAALPALQLGFLRDDWLLLWAHVDPISAPSGALGVFPRPLARAYWWIVGNNSSPLLAHLLALAIGVAALLGFWLCLRRLGVARGATLWALALFGTHTALLELRVWAAASNGLIALALSCWALWAWAGGRRWWGLLCLLLAVAARADAVLALPLCLSLSPRLHKQSWLLPFAAGALALFGTLRAAHAEFSFAWADAGQALRLLLFPWGSALPAMAAVLVACSGLLLFVTGFAQAWRDGRAPRANELAGLRAAACLVIVLTALAGASLPWAFAGRYLAFAVLALSLLLATRPPQRRWERIACLLLLGAHLASDLGGRTLRELKARSQAETALFDVASSLPAHCETEVVLWAAPPMGWRNSAADAENVLSSAWHCATWVRLADATPSKATATEAPQLALRFEGGRWVLVDSKGE